MSFLLGKELYYSLHQESKINKSIYKTIIKKIPGTIFSKLDINFFLKNIQKKIIYLYVIKKKKKIISVLTFVDSINILKLKKNIFFFFLKNPLKFIKNIFFIIRNLNKSNSSLFKNPNYLHLLHLVIQKNAYYNHSLSKKDFIFNKFFKIISKKHDVKNIFLCYNQFNIKAQKFYTRNKFKFISKSGNMVFVKKKFL